MRQWAAALPIYFLIATAIGFADFRMRAHPARGYEAYPQAVVANTEEPPGKYRVLAPFVFEGVVAATGADRQVLWVAFRWVSLLAGLLATHVLLTTWFSSAHAITGSMFSVLALLLTFTNSWPHPDHLVEWALSAGAVAAIARGRHAVFGGLLVLAALNRETSAFLVLLYVVASPWPWTGAHLRRAAVWSVVWGLLYAGLRYWRGVAWYDPWQVTRNLEFLGLLPDTYDPYFRAYAWFGVVLLAPVAWLGWRSWSRQPLLARAAALVVIPAFVVTAFCFSSIVETRIFTPLIPMLAVLVMFAVVDADRTTTPKC
jgi:hypothetical protein